LVKQSRSFWEHTFLCSYVMRVNTKPEPARPRHQEHCLNTVFTQDTVLKLDITPPVGEGHEYGLVPVFKFSLGVNSGDIFRRGGYRVYSARYIHNITYNRGHCRTEISVTVSTAQLLQTVIPPGKICTPQPLKTWIRPPTIAKADPVSGRWRVSLQLCVD